MRAPRAARAPPRRSRRRRRASSGGVVSRARLAAERSTCSIDAAGTPRPTRSRQQSRTSRTSPRSASCLAGEQVRVVRAQAVLLEHDLPQQAAGQKRDPLRVGKGGRPDELGDGLEVVGLGEEPQRPLARGSPQRLVTGDVPLGDPLGVARRRVAPAHRGVVPRVGEVGVERPDAAREPPRMRADGLGHVAPGRRDRAEDRHGGVVAAQRPHPARPLVERREGGGEAGGIALLGGELAGARGDLAQRFGPAGGRVGDQHRVVPHVPVELRHGDARVDARLPGQHGHVRRVRDEDGAVEERPAGPRVVEPRHLLQHVGHLVAALAAADVDDHVRVAPLRDLLQEHGLARAEAPGHGGAAAAGDREEEIEGALPGEQRHVGPQALAHGAGAANGPVVRQGDLRAADARDRVFDRELAGRGDPVDRAAAARRDAHPVRDRRGLGHLAQDRSRFDPVAGGGERRERPAPLALERHSPPSVVQRLARPGEPAQHAVEDAPEQPRPELGPQGMARARHGVSGPEPARVRVHLNRRGAPVEGDHLARQPVVGPPRRARACPQRDRRPRPRAR